MPIAFGSNLPRAPGERPIGDVSYKYANVIGELADRLTGVCQDINYSSGRAAWHIRRKEFSIPVATGYGVRTIAQMGVWASRASHSFAEHEESEALAAEITALETDETEGLEVIEETAETPGSEAEIVREIADASGLYPYWFKALPSVRAGWVARELELLLASPSSGVGKLTKIHILPADSRFRPKALQ